MLHRFFVCSTLALLLCGTGQAQTTFASITGAVTDPSGAAVPGVRVVATSPATGATASAESNQAGIYTIAQIKEGEYTLQAEAQGFRKARVEGLVLQARDNRRVDIVLQVGDMVEKLEVTAGVTLIETESARISETRTAQELRTLPMNTTTIHQFMSLSPGVTPADPTAEASFYGSRKGQAWYTTDGVTNIGTRPQLRSLEWVQELKIDAANNSAEFSGLGNVTMISKSGTNALHGSGFWQYQTPMLRARGFFASERGPGDLPPDRGFAERPVVRAAGLQRQEPHFLLLLAGSAGAEPERGAAAPHGTAAVLAQRRFLRGRVADPQPVHRRDLPGRPHSGLRHQPGGEEDPGAFLPAA